MPLLTGRRILITRPATHASGPGSALDELLRAEGAETIRIPTIELQPPASWCGLDAALSALRSFDWVVFTSANAVEAFAARARRLGVAPVPRRVAAIGPATARAVTERGVATAVDLMPARYVAESLAEALVPYAPGASMLLVRAAVARDVVPVALGEAGAQVTIAEAYRTEVPAASVAALRTLFATRPPDAATLTSASTVENLAALLAEAGLALPPSVALASIGPVTSAAARALGLEPAVEARESTIPALVEALVAAFAAG